MTLRVIGHSASLNVDVAASLGDLLMRSHDALHGDGTARAVKAENQASETIEWLVLLRSEAPQFCASELLDGAAASLLEFGAYVGIGHGRAAIVVLRTTVDLILGTSYFSVHPVEWETVSRSGNGFMLRADIEQFHRQNIEGFGTRLGAMEQGTGWTLRQMYGILSAHVHAQTGHTIPRSGAFEDLVSSAQFLDSVLDLQHQTLVALCNYLAAVYGADAMSLPESTRRRLTRTLTRGQYLEAFPR